MQNKNNQVAAEEREIRMVKKDIRTVAVLNTAFLVMMLALYFWNRSSNGLERLFSEYIKF